MVDQDIDPDFTEEETDEEEPEEETDEEGPEEGTTEEGVTHQQDTPGIPPAQGQNTILGQKRARAYFSMKLVQNSYIRVQLLKTYEMHYRDTKK
ncbi:hypothetical protein AA313_de0207104 [Arthrobotrys entomopaga]|nr:hypothetical protein AA313_de0207104 [Arthrobotrys entomopaga]